MYRSVKEERMEKQLKGIVRTVIWAGVLLLVGSVLFAMILSDATDRAAAYQLHARTEEYSSRLYEQIDSDYQIMDTFASIIGSSGITDREDFPELLDQANDWAQDAAENEEEEPEEITREQFMERLELDAVQISADGRFEFWFNDGDLFWGHAIHVTGSLDQGPESAQMEG